MRDSSEQGFAEKICICSSTDGVLAERICSEVVKCTDRVDCRGLDPGTIVSKGFMMTGLL